MLQWLASDDIGAHDTVRSTAGFFAPAVDIGIARGHTYVVPGEAGVEAIAIWSPPDVPLMSEDDHAVFGMAFHGAYGDDALMRLVALDELTAEMHPEDSHFYLFVLGAATPGRGAGAEAVAPVHGRCDAQGLGAYLESSNPRNLGFYERLGYREVWQERPTPNGPLITGMWRDPLSS